MALVRGSIDKLAIDVVDPLATYAGIANQVVICGDCHAAAVTIEGAMRALTPWREAYDEIFGRMQARMLNHPKYSVADVPLIEAECTSLVRDVEHRHPHGRVLSGWSIAVLDPSEIVRTHMIVLIAVDPSGKWHDLSRLAGVPTE